MLKHLYLVATLFSLTVLAALGTPARANSTAWVDKAAVRYRMISAQIDGQDYVALQMQLKPGWHTYWRYPGASGIAPEFDFGASRGVKTSPAIFPAPFFFDDGVGGFYGYEGETGFVFRVDAQGAATVKLKAFLGVCREVCIPIEIKQTMAMSPSRLAASQNGDTIARLLAAQAKAANSELKIERVTFDGVSLQLVVSGQDLQAPQVMSVPGPYDILGSPRLVAQHPASNLIEIPAWSKLDHPLIGRKLTFLVRDGAKAIEQTVEVSDHRLLPRLTPHSD